MQRIMRIEMISSAFAEIRQALDRVTVGYHEFKDALVVAIVKQALGIRGGHVLVFGPTGTAKTHTTKGLAQILTSTGVPVAYARVQGDADTMPQDFLKRRKADYDEHGRPVFKWELQTVEKFERKPDQVLPGLFQFDELDKIPAKAQHGLLEAMEEQQVTIPKVGPVKLNFTLIATANTRKFDPTAQPLSRAIQDRFGSVVILGYQNLEADLEMLEQCTSSLLKSEVRLNHFPVEELRQLKNYIRESGLPIHVASEMKKAIVTAVKLTQQRLDGYTDFTRYIKVPAGPRGILDLYWESGISALLAGADELTAEFPLEVGVRVLRGRVEVTPEAELEGISTDVLIRKILAEVFGDMPRSSARREKVDFRVSSESDSSDTDLQDSDKKDEDSDKNKEGNFQAEDSQTNKSRKDVQKEVQSRKESQSSRSNEWKKEGFLAAFRKEVQKEKSQTHADSDNDSKKDSDSSDDDSNGGDDGDDSSGGSKFDSENVKDQESGGDDNGGDSSVGSKSDAKGDHSGSDPGSEGNRGDSGSKDDSATRGKSSKGDSVGRFSLNEVDSQTVSVKTIASREALAQYLAQQAAADKFKTREGLKTGAEIAQNLASGKQKFDFQSTDGKFQAHVRGSKAICQGPSDEIQKLIFQHDQIGDGFGKADVGGHRAGKGFDFPTLDVFTFPPEIASITLRSWITARMVTFSIRFHPLYQSSSRT